MALFPAYAKSENTSPSTKPNEDILSFSSYKIDEPSTSKNNEETKQKNEPLKSSEDNESKNSSEHLKSKKVKKKQKTVKIDLRIEDSFENEDFIIDKSSVRVFLKVDTISRPSVPKYKRTAFILGGSIIKAKRKKKSDRYFHPKYLYKEEQTETNANTKGNGIEAEDDISRKTAFYNQSLGKDPFDVDLWLQYIRFQDVVWKFEKIYKKGSIAKGARVTAERKLSILDKALTHNPNDEALTRERVLIAETVYPADELSQYLKGFVEKNASNIILWQGYIEASQCSMAHCNTPAIVSMYNQCLSKLHQLRRASALEKSLLEERILSMLYQCGLFLRQTGLWEQLWTLLHLYLELNLTPLKIICNQFDDKLLTEFEEVVLDSQLPLHELWLRVEKLRESCHWFPWKGTEPCEDPQRMVFTDDVSDLIHPITSTGNTFRLIITTLTLLKIPLLPFRHTTIEELGLDYVPWSLDTVETIYPVFYPMYPINLQNDYLLKDAFQFLVGPQYLKTHPGQEEYLNFVTNLMKNCASSLQSTERTAIFLWWFHFERFLIALDKQKRFKMPSGRNKKTKAAIKEFLKEETNRNNVLFYREYALIEYELGNVETAFKILLTAIGMQSNENSNLSLLNNEDRMKLCSLYRTLIELHLDTNTDKNKIITYLTTLVSGPNAEIEDSLQTYKHLTTELLKETQTNLTIPEHFLPDYNTDLLICYGWFLHLVRTSFEAGTMIENALKEMEDQPWRREVLMEWYVTVFYKTCTEQLGSGIYGLFNDILHRGLISFPNNLYLLAIACKEQSTTGCVGKSWWKLNEILSNSGHALPALFLIIIANQQLTQIQDQWNNFDNDNPISTLTTYKNRIVSLFTRLTQVDMCTKRCGLLWRFYLQYLYAYSDSDACRKAYYAAVEECPWLKVLYIDAAIYIPAELPQIQDLIIEKQLRIHVTPEELDVLRT